MKIKLQDIEQFVKQDQYLLAEALLDDAVLKGLKEIEKNLWVAWIHKEAIILEVEVQLRGQNAINATCDCPAEAAELCPHIIATILAIRKQKEAIPAPVAPQSTAVVPDEPTEITNTDFIAELSEYDVYQFVKSYANRDKRFLLALKVHFATQFGELKGQEGYTEILVSAQKSLRRSGSRFSLQGQRDYLKVVDKLLKQNKFAYNNQDWRASFDLTMVLLEQLLANLPFTDKTKRPFLDRVRQTLIFALDLAVLPLAPEVEEQFLRFFFQYISKNGLAFKFLGQELIACARQKVQTPEHQNELLKILQVVGQKMDTNHPHWSALSSTVVDLASHLGDAQLTALSKPTTDPDIILLSLAALEKRFAYGPMKKLCVFSRTLHTAPDFLAIIHEYELKMAIQENNKAEILELAKIRLLESMNPNYYQVLKKTLAPSKWSAYQKKLLKQLKTLKFSPSLQTLIGEVYRIEKSPEQLLDYACEQQALPVLHEHGNWLKDYLPKELEAGYPKTILAYAEQHVGPVAAKQISSCLKHVIGLFGEASAEVIIAELRTQHPLRHALWESIDTLQA